MCFLAYAYFLADFSLVLLIKVLLVKRKRVSDFPATVKSKIKFGNDVVINKRHFDTKNLQLNIFKLNCLAIKCKILKLEHVNLFMGSLLLKQRRALKLSGDVTLQI